MNRSEASGRSFEISAGQLIAAIHIFSWIVDLNIRRRLAKRVMRGGLGRINFTCGRGLLSARSIARAFHIRLDNYIYVRLRQVTVANAATRGYEAGREARVVTSLRQRASPVTTATDPATRLGLERGM
jgi:hypothetical protein